ncbi:MAG: hypothetical protein IPG23_28720 [Burkholderiales bacterium]|nr:hypothetical protein [Burkholderiales bacterium]
MDRSLRVGVHGLPLMGSGDWNDGMNRVGIEGRRVGLAGLVLVPVGDRAGTAGPRVATWRASPTWDDAAEAGRPRSTVPWDGPWFKRAFLMTASRLGARPMPRPTST